MRGSLIAVAGIALVVVTISAQGNEKPSDAFMKAMRDNADAARAIRVASKEFEESGSRRTGFRSVRKGGSDNEGVLYHHSDLLARRRRRMAQLR